MTDELGMVELEKEGEGTPYGFKPYSEATAAKIDEAVKKILDEAHAKAVEIVENNRKKHRIIAEALLKYETLDEKQIYSLYKTGKMPKKSSEEFPSEAKALSYEEAKEAAQKRAEEKAEEDTAEKQALATPSEDAVKPETDAAKLAEPDASASQEDPADSLPTPSESDLPKDPEKDDNDAPSQKTEQTDDSDKDE
jgi:cell division protease FtsH